MNITLPVIQNNSPCCSPPVGSQISQPALNQPFITGSIKTIIGIVPQVSSTLMRADHWGSLKARWGAGRMNYSIAPGLYALNNPDANSPVLVTANYKMSFDRLREALPGRNIWILVLDTKGINVWCAAGKGAFGTDELINKIESCGLKELVSHRKIILPQLGAPGVAGHQVKKRAGFTVLYGPIRARDIVAYLDNGFKADTKMRTINFTLKERAVLIPIELVEIAKPFGIIALVFFFMAGILGPANFWPNTWASGLLAVFGLLCGVLAGAMLSPLFLPYLPGRAFSLKGFSIGIVTAIGFLFWRNMNFAAWPDRIEAISWLLLIPAIASYLAMNFTGASTYTSLSGVKKEMRFALPMQISAATGGFLLWFASRLIA